MFFFVNVGRSHLSLQNGTPGTGSHSLKIDKIEFVHLNMATHLFVELAS